MSDEDGPDGAFPGDPAGLNSYLDAADRLERTVEEQVSIVNGIDDKAEHATRLIGILVGLVFSVLSVVTNFEGIDASAANLPMEIAFVLGIGSLLIAMGAAIVTYLSTRFRIGLDSSVGYYLSDPDTETDFDTHIRRVVGSYGEMIEKNQRVIQNNSKRFRRTLYFLLTGVLFISTAGSLYIGQLAVRDAWLGLGLSMVVATTSGWYILTGKYLTLQPVPTHDD